MSGRLVIDDGPIFVRAARWRGARAVALELLPAGGAADPAPEGSIWFGRVRKVASAIDAAFVDLGTGEAGFLNTPGAVHEGQGLVVQVMTAPQGGKGAKLGRDIALPGRLALLRPGKRGVKFSHRFPALAKRSRLAASAARLAGEDGLTLRAAAAHAPPELLAAEVGRLKLAWKAIAAKASAATAPACLWRDEDALAPVLRDHADSGVESIMVAGAAGFARARAWLALHAPDLVDRLQPRAGGFPRDEFEEEFANALAPTVVLAGGGLLHFDEGRALTAIDVDTAGASADVGDVNREAADEIARQLRLRAVGGAVVVDFLRLAKADARAKLLAQFRKALAIDPARCRLLGFSRLGLVELTRGRRGPSLASRWFEAERGVPGPRAAAHMALMQAAALAAGRRVRQARIACVPAVARVIERADRAAVTELVGAPVAAESGAGHDAGPAIMLE